MGSKKEQQASCSKCNDIVVPMTTLAQSESDILVGTLVWGKFKDWPWWPGKDPIRISKDIFQLLPLMHLHPFYRPNCDQC